jgi:ADP-ribose pyrophosphatase
MSYQVMEKQVLYTGSKVRLEIHRLMDDEGRRLQKEVCIHPGAVVVLPFIAEQKIILIRTRRYAVNQILIELPAGTLEKNEDPMNAAGRELLEETGYLAHRMRPLLNFYTSPGILSEKMYAFAAYDLKKGHSALEPGEEIEPFAIGFDEAIGMVKSGEIADGKTMTTLLWYERFCLRR